MAIFSSIEQFTDHKAGSSVPPPPSTRALRNRTKPGPTNNGHGGPEVEKRAPRKSVGGSSAQKPQGALPPVRKQKGYQESVTLRPGGHTAGGENGRGSLPKVILRLGKKPEDAAV